MSILFPEVSLIFLISSTMFHVLSESGVDESAISEDGQRLLPCIQVRATECSAGEEIGTRAEIVDGCFEQPAVNYIIVYLNLIEEYA